MTESRAPRWAIAETRAFRRMYDLLSDAQSNGLTAAAVGDAGCGKTVAAAAYAASHANVMLLSCSEYWNRRKFMEELARAAGVGDLRRTIAETMDAVVLAVGDMERPLVVLDEADKLCDAALCFFITLYNELDGRCGLVMCATHFLERRIRRGVEFRRRGYEEILSRLGRRFVPLQAVGAEDVAAVCAANGVTAPEAVRRIIDGSEGDLRRVRRRIHSVRRSEAAR